MCISLFLIVGLFGAYLTDASLILNGKEEVYEHIDILKLSCDFEKTPETNYGVEKLEIKSGQRVLATLFNDQKITVTKLLDVTATGIINNADGGSNLNVTIWKVTNAQSARTYRCFAVVEDRSGDEQVLQSNSLVVKVLKPSQQQTAEYTWTQLRSVDKLFVKFNELWLITSKLENLLSGHVPSTSEIVDNQLVKGLEEEIQKLSQSQTEFLEKYQKEKLEVKTIQEDLKKKIVNLEKTFPSVSSDKPKPDPELQEVKKKQDEIKTQFANLSETIKILSSNQAKPNPEVQAIKQNQEALKSQIAKLEGTSKLGIRIEEGSYSCGYDFQNFPKTGTDSSRIEEVTIQYKQKFETRPFVFQSMLFQDLDVEDEVMYAIDIRDESNTGFVGMCVKYQTPIVYELQVKWFAIEARR